MPATGTLGPFGVRSGGASRATDAAPTPIGDARTGTAGLFPSGGVRAPSSSTMEHELCPPRSCLPCIAPCSTASRSSRRAAIAPQADRVRAEATRIYSRAWDDRARRELDRRCSDAHAGRPASASRRTGRGVPAPERPRRLTVRVAVARRSAVGGACRDDPRRHRPRPRRLRRARARSARRSRTSGRTSPTSATRGATRFDAVATARGDEPLPERLTAALDRAIDEIGRIEDPHRAIDWLSTFPQVVLVALGEPTVRFQDAARDARAVVYAGIQADPLVARAADAAGRRDAGPAGAGPGGDERRDDRRRRLAGDVPDAVRAGCDRRCGRRRRAPRRSSTSSLAVADRGEQVRSQVRGAIVEELTARLLARRVGPAAVRRERRILFDGVRAEIHPYDVTVERDGAAEAYDCKWGARGINADVLHQLDDARTHAADEDEPLRVALVVFDAERSCEVRLEPPDRAARRRPAWSRSRRSTSCRRRRDDRPRAGSPAPPRTGSASTRPAPDGLLRTSVLLRYAQDLAWFHSSARGFGRDWYAERGLTWLVRAAEVAVVAPVRVGDELVGTTQVVGWPTRLGPAPDRVPSTPTGRWPRGSTSTGSCSTPAVRRRASRPSSTRSSGAPTAIELGRVELGADAGRCRPSGARRSGRRSSTRWTTSTTPSTPTGSRRRSSRPAVGPTCARSRAWPARVRPRGRGRRDRRGDDLAGRDGAWSCRIADADGADLLRARLEAGPVA